MFYGAGAGGTPTASAVLGDIVAVARNRLAGTRGPELSTYAELPVLPMGDTLTRYHVSLDVADKPGVLAPVAEAFARHGVSIQAVRQTSRGEDALLIIVTHEARDADLAATISELQALPVVRAVASVMRVEGEGDQYELRSDRPTTGQPTHRGARAVARHHHRVPGPAPGHGRDAAVTLQEGGTPLLPAPVLSARTGCDVYLKVEGLNPTGSFKDRGMTTAITVAAAQGAKAVICASTGNTSASAAAYAARAGLTCAVLVPKGKIAIGKLAQALVHGAKLLQVDGSFDDCLELARKLSIEYPVALVNSVNPDRLQGQKTAAFEIVDALGDAPDIHCLPVGNAGNITAYWMGYQEYFSIGLASRKPRMFGFQASGAAPIVDGAPVSHPQTIATAIRIGNPASWHLAEEARDASGGADRQGHRPGDPRRVPDHRARRGGIRRARLVGQRGRPAGRVGGRADPGGLPRGLHDHRQRPEGPGLGPVRCSRPDHGPGRRRLGGGRPWPGLAGVGRSDIIWDTTSPLGAICIPHRRRPAGRGRKQ